jgi:hypothetical protein
MADLVYYDFASALTPASVASGISAVGSMASNLGGYFQISSSDSWDTNPVLVTSPASGNTSAALALANNQYFTTPAFTADANGLKLTSLNFNVGRGGSSTPRGIIVRASINGGAYGADLYNAAITTQTPTWSAVNIDLTGAAYQNITSIAFRIWVYTPSSSTSVDFDDMTLKGTVAGTGTVGTAKPFSQAIVIA